MTPGEICEEAYEAAARKTTVSEKIWEAAAEAVRAPLVEEIAELKKWRDDAWRAIIKIGMHTGRPCAPGLVEGVEQLIEENRRLREVVEKCEKALSSTTMISHENLRMCPTCGHLAWTPAIEAIEALKLEGEG